LEHFLYVQHWHDGERQCHATISTFKTATGSSNPSGATFKNDHDAIERAKAVAIVVSIDKPEVDPTRYISVLNEGKSEIFKVPVYSKPTALW
jgi:hypothetical protein